MGIETAIIGGVSALGSALISSDAASDAAQTQADAADRSAELQYKMYQEQKALQEPYREAGLTAQNRLLGYLGLSPQAETEAEIRARLTPQFQTQTPYGGAQIPDGGFFEPLRYVYSKVLGNYDVDQAGLDAAVQAELAKQKSTGVSSDFGKYATAEFTPAMFASYQDPGYAWRMSEGMKALEKSAAARGGLLSGATLKGIQQYGQGLASEEYQNAFNRYQTTRANTLSPYFQLQNVGQNAASNTGAAAGQYATGASQALTSGAAASAAGQLGSASAYSSALGNIGNYALQQNYLNQLRSDNTYPSTYAGPSDLPVYTPPSSLSYGWANS